MKGKLVGAVKKWWIAVLVLTLALSLTSCGKKKLTTTLNANYAISYVSGSLVDIDAYVIDHGNDAFELVLVVYQGTNGDIITCAIVNSQSLAYVVFAPQTVVSVGAEIAAVRLSRSQLLNYNVIACRPFTTGDFLSGTVVADASGPLPLPPSMQSSGLYGASR